MRSDVPEKPTYPIPFDMLTRGQKRYLANRGYSMGVPRSRRLVEYEAVSAARDIAAEANKGWVRRIATALDRYGPF